MRRKTTCSYLAGQYTMSCHKLFVRNVPRYSDVTRQLVTISNITVSGPITPMLFSHITLDGQVYYNNMCHTNLHFSVFYVFELNADPNLCFRYA